ncbi:RsfA family transcriptional regulator [Solibacillus sp. MA9]|uniref:RsfA family transcriptional regulator n=1 Tax=Solibacillus palustris TaxID=2908203 RepID=A0ABS9U904_9BACL|nr:RsfA family transcriptional regulator [Solibacillus sp. MA9]MCH7320515.1 RsfA family transcriptional regulator [Solibacillus sp. MA9]
MTKSRQDAWIEENDALLAEAVIRHVKEGSTQLNAFEEAGDLLNRTAAACGFRWNAVVRRIYEEDLSQAKKERKERMRLMNQATKRRTTPLYLLPSNEEQPMSIPLSALSLDIVIAYLVRLQHNNSSEHDVLKWRKLTTLLTEQKQQLEQQLHALQKENKAIKEDYEQFVSIMNRARRLVAFEDEDGLATPTFKMEKNGNLVSQTSITEVGDVHP